MIDIQIDYRRLDAVIYRLAAEEKQIKKALRSTVSKMSSWLRTRAGRVIRAETALKAVHLKKRLKSIKIKFKGDGATGGVWIGLDDIPLKGFSPEQSRFGVSAGPPGRVASYRGAFMGPKPGSVAPSLKGHVFKRRRKGRTPIDWVGMAIHEDAQNALRSDVFTGFNEKFYQVFEHELRWQTRTRK